MRGRWAFFTAFALVACGGDEEGGPNDPGAGSDIEPCEIVTQADATALFGEPASPDTGPVVTDPGYIGDCLWQWETPDALGSQLLALNLWRGTDYYAPGPNAEPFDIGDEGSVQSSAGAGVDVLWTQGEVTAVLSYFTVGMGVPDHLTKLEQVKALALEASERL